MEDDCDFDHSQLSGQFKRNGITVEVEIYRIAGTNDPWRLEVVHEHGGCTRWYTHFATEREAYQAFLAVVETDGISFFGSVGTDARH